MSIPRLPCGCPWHRGSEGRSVLRRWRNALAVTVLVGAALTAPASAQDDPQGGQGAEPGVTVAPSVEDEAAAERRLRMALVNAGAAWAAPAADLATWLEVRSRFMEASSLRRRVRGADPTTENCVLEARAGPFEIRRTIRVGPYSNLCISTRIANADRRPHRVALQTHPELARIPFARAP